MFAQTLDHMLQSYGYYVVFAVIGLEAMGLPLPGESMLIGASIYAAATGKLDIAFVITAAAAGAILGDNLGYVIGRKAGFPLLKRYGGYVGLNDRRMKVGAYLFEKHGGAVVFTGRFIAILRTFVALMAGANHMHWKVFLFWNAVGGIAWTTLYCTTAYLLGDVVRQIEGKLAWGLGGVAVIVIGVAVWFLRRNERHLEDKAEQAMKADRAA
jgi:membrane protein DedA with SNARE-associated domain